MRVAIIGAGVAGLVAAYRLRGRAELTLFEADSRLGGHAHTWEVVLGARRYALDTGFLVYNERNYPRFTRLLAELGVETQPSTMSFSVRHDEAGIEYNGSSLRQLYADPRNLVRPAFGRMVLDILRFGRWAPEAVAGAMADASIDELLRAGGFSAAFRDWYLVPMGAAIWSLPARQVLEFPARFFVEFFANHGMLGVNGRPQWRVVRGGSTRYVSALVSRLDATIRRSTAVRDVRRDGSGVLIDGERFDRVILACHADQALGILGDASPRERAVLQALPFQVNDAVVHTDASVLPRRRRAWGAWNYRAHPEPGRPVSVTYLLNDLHSLRAPESFCVTLNDDGGIDPARVIGRVRYAHPVVTPDGVSARAARSGISGERHTHFCGAYWGAGFHEDGVVSAESAAAEVLAAARPLLEAR